ncbi:MAG: type II toxin-antitoxin system VapC family toxin [Clostridia bacterium]|nr:type II toxin-antitoxin system VapC family toxin [Clostridia bacterium]
MNGIDFLADTNAVLYLLSGNHCMEPYRSNRFAVSIISVMELLSFPNITPKEETIIRQFLSTCQQIPLNEKITEAAIHLRREHHTKLPDAIIAATAVCNELTLLTADTGFSKINELSLVSIQPLIIDYQSGE